jgi:hypothetical protein
MMTVFKETQESTNKSLDIQNSSVIIYKKDNKRHVINLFI